MKRLAGVGVAVLLTGCASAPSQQGMNMPEDPAGLWRASCTHCHNLRAAPEFTAQQWPVIVQHMRTHGDLTRSQAVAISEYLERLTE